jgi:hypothetical protein
MFCFTRGSHRRSGFTSVTAAATCFFNNVDSSGLAEELTGRYRQKQDHELMGTTGRRNRPHQGRKARPVAGLLYVLCYANMLCRWGLNEPSLYPLRRDGLGFDTLNLADVRADGSCDTKRCRVGLVRDGHVKLIHITPRRCLEGCCKGQPPSCKAMLLNIRTWSWVSSRPGETT